MNAKHGLALQLQRFGAQIFYTKHLAKTTYFLKARV